MKFITKTSKSLVNLFKILPSGILSKNSFKGANKSECNIF